ncbi:hypothetical protein E4U30_006003 [Claviceps sp. LM220 group G6]|nr:hypothetical protein E4U30_006003 [Claviceps sp. LM220 group G6]
MEHKVWIDAIKQSRTAGYITNFRMLAESMHVRESADLEGLSAKDLRILAILLLNGLRDHPAGAMLHQPNGKRVSDRFWLVNAATPLPCLKPLLSGAIDQEDDEIYGNKSRGLFRKIACPPTSHNGGLVANSSEHRKDVDHLMREELGQIHVGIPHLLQAFFPHHVYDLRKESRDFFKKCKRGRTPSYKDDTWTDWPAVPSRRKSFGDSEQVY